MGSKTKYVVVSFASIFATVVILGMIGMSMENEVLIIPKESIQDENKLVVKPIPKQETFTYHMPLAPKAETLIDKNNNSLFAVDNVITAGENQFYTSTLELKIHELVNNERKQQGLKELSYDKTLSYIARTHSQDMLDRNYFAHMNPDGLESFDRGYVYGYYHCGDQETIRLANEFDKFADEYDRLLIEYEAGGSNDEMLYNKLSQMYDELESMRIKVNKLLLEKPAFDGIAENLFQNSLYEQAWYVEGEIVSYDWNTYEEIAKTTVDGWMKSPNHRDNLLTPSYETEGIGIVADEYKIYITQNFC